MIHINLLAGAGGARSASKKKAISFGIAQRMTLVCSLILVVTVGLLLLVLGTEFFYVGDVFNSRMNTVFKLYYQAWMMLALAGGFALYYLASRWRQPMRLWTPFACGDSPMTPLRFRDCR